MKESYKGNENSTYMLYEFFHKMITKIKKFLSID